MALLQAKAGGVANVNAFGEVLRCLNTSIDLYLSMPNVIFLTKIFRRPGYKTFRRDLDTHMWAHIL
jgi:hypothetical protein